jgi:hypothetical protein
VALTNYPLSSILHRHTSRELFGYQGETSAKIEITTYLEYFFMGNRFPPNGLTNTKSPSDFPNVPVGQHPYGPAAPYGIFSDDAHDSLLKSKGFRALHYKHALNPNRETVEEGVDLSTMTTSGYVFYDPEEFWVVPQNIGWQDTYVIQGVHGTNSISLNHTGYYTNGERVYLRPGDIVVIQDDITVMVQQLVEFKNAPSQKLKMPIVSVDYLANGNGRRYEEGVDFTVSQGIINWLQSPLWDAKNKRGEVLSCVYWTKPRFNVVATPKVFRMVWSNASGNDRLQAAATYLPGNCIVNMSWLSPNELDENIGWP